MREDLELVDRLPVEAAVEVALLELGEPNLGQQPLELVATV